MNQKKIEATKARLPEDVMALCRTYSLTQLSYIDISEQEQLSDMMKRWSLLEELRQQK